MPIRAVDWVFRIARSASKSLKSHLRSEQQRRQHSSSSQLYPPPPPTTALVIPLRISAQATPSISVSITQKDPLATMANKKNQHQQNKSADKQRERQMRNEMRRNQRKEQARKTWAVEAADLQKFTDQLAPFGVELKDVKGDGNCLFRALADQLNGDAENGHRALRQQIVEYIRQHRDDFEPFLEAEEEESFEDYVEDLAKDGFYSGHWALVAASRLLDSNVFIHQIGQPIWKIMADSSNNGHHTRTLHVAYYGWEHYSSVRHINGPHTGPANIELAEIRPINNAPINNTLKRKEKAPANGDLLSFNERTIMQSTNCKDIERIRNILTVHNNDLNAALDEMFAVLAEDEALAALDSVHLSDFPSNSDLDEEAMLQAMYEAAVGVEPQHNHDQGSSSKASPSSSVVAPSSSSSVSSPSSTTSKKTTSSTTTNAKQPQLSNSKRKELAKKERKERRHEEQRREANGTIATTPAQPDQQVGSICI